MTETILWALAIAYALRGAYTAGVIKSWLAWSGAPFNPFAVAWAGLTWPLILIAGYRAQGRDK